MRVRVKARWDRRKIRTRTPARTHIAHQRTVSIQGQTHTVYVPPGMVEAIKGWRASRKRMERIRKDVSKLNMAIIHRHVPGNRAGSTQLILKGSLLKP